MKVIVSFCKYPTKHQKEKTRGTYQSLCHSFDKGKPVKNPEFCLYIYRGNIGKITGYQIKIIITKSVRENKTRKKTYPLKSAISFIYYSLFS